MVEDRKNIGELNKQLLVTRSWLPVKEKLN